MRIAILNQPLGNRGDEAAHKALMRTLVKEFPQHRFAVILLNVQPDLIDTFKVPTVEYINIRGTSKAAIRSTLEPNNILYLSDYQIIHSILVVI